MSCGWAIGSIDFKSAMMKKLDRLQSIKNQNTNNLREINELRWTKFLQEGIKHFQKTTGKPLSSKKSALWKLIIATWMRQHTSVPNKWLAENLQMGTPGTVSAYVGQFLRKGETKTQQFRNLSQKLNKLMIEA